jgi:hypothetical protein
MSVIVARSGAGVSLANPSIVVEQGPDFPSTAEVGQLFFKTTDEVGLYINLNSGWSFVGPDGTLNDERYVLKAGDTMTGDLTVEGTVAATSISVGSGISTSEVIQMGSLCVQKVGSIETSSTTQAIVDTFLTSQYRSAKYVLSAIDTVTSEFYMTELMLSKDAGDVVYYGEYSTVASSGPMIVNYAADYDGAGSIRLLVTPSSNNLTNIKFQVTLFNR